jgi:hypothetical protein
MYSLNSMKSTHSNLKFIKTIWFIPLLSHCCCLKIFFPIFHIVLWPGIQRGSTYSIHNLGGIWTRDIPVCDLSAYSEDAWFKSGWGHCLPWHVS